MSPSVSASRGRTIPLEIPEDLERAFAGMKELLSHPDLEEFSRLVKLAQAADGFRLVGRGDGGRLVAVMGDRILHGLVRG